MVVTFSGGGCAARISISRQESTADTNNFASFVYINDYFLLSRARIAREKEDECLRERLRYPALPNSFHS